MNILTIGKNGQLAQCINKVLEEKNSEHKFYFSDRNEIDITDFLFILLILSKILTPNTRTKKQSIKL